MNIEFRGKRIDNGQWVYGFLSQGFTPSSDYRELGNYIVFYIPEKGMQSVEIDPNTIGQYIGLNDNDGKKRYKGDILGWGEESDDGSLYEVIFEDACFKRSVLPWMTKKAMKRDDILEKECKFLFDEITQDLIVVGNIFDNPEMLKLKRT